MKKGEKKGNSLLLPVSFRKIHVLRDYKHRHDILEKGDRRNRPTPVSFSCKFLLEK